jgi:hypothetical protein
MIASEHGYSTSTDVAERAWRQPLLSFRAQIPIPKNLLQNPPKPAKTCQLDSVSLAKSPKIGTRSNRLSDGSAQNSRRSRQTPPKAANWHQSINLDCGSAVRQPKIFVKAAKSRQRPPTGVNRPDWTSVQERQDAVAAPLNAVALPARLNYWSEFWSA